MIEQLNLHLPLARRTDPDTSRAAARAAEPGVGALEQAILTAANYSQPTTAFLIAERVEVANPGRWDEGGIRTRVSNMGKRGLLVKDGKGKSPRGRDADRWRLP